MNIKIPENLNAVDAIRRCGYGLVNDRRNPKQSFARRLGSGFYPRFHVYLEGGMIKLHLDQKQASYEGYSAHSGEYGGEVVEREGARIQGIIDNLSAQPAINDESENQVEKGGFWGLFKK